MASLGSSPLRISLYKGLGLMPALFVHINTVTFVLYGMDKLLAQLGYSRIPESTLHGFEWMGGSIGGFLAQWVLRHKISKTSYQHSFLIISAVHLASAAVAWPFAAWLSLSARQLLALNTAYLTMVFVTIARLRGRRRKKAEKGGWVRPPPRRRGRRPTEDQRRYHYPRGR